MSKELVEWLRGEAEYDMQAGEVVYGENELAAADLIERQSNLIQEMFVVMINRCDEKDPKVKEVLIRAIKEQPDEDALSQ